MAASPDRAGGHLCAMGVTWLISFTDCPDRWSGLKVTIQENIIDTAENPLLSIIDARTKPLRYVNLNPSQSWKSCSETLFPFLLFADTDLKLRARKGLAKTTW